MNGDSFLTARSLGVPIRSRSSFSVVTTRLNMGSSSPSMRAIVVQPKETDPATKSTVGVVAARGVRIGTFGRFPLGESPETECVDVDGLRAPVQDHLGHADADGRRDLEAGAAEGRREIESVDA